MSPIVLLLTMKISASRECTHTHKNFIKSHCVYLLHCSPPSFIDALFDWCRQCLDKNISMTNTYCVDAGHLLLINFIAFCDIASHDKRI